MRRISLFPILTLLVALGAGSRLLGLDHVLAHAAQHAAAACSGAPHEEPAEDRDEDAPCLLCALPASVAAPAPVAPELTAPSESGWIDVAEPAEQGGIHLPIHRSRGPPPASF